MPEFHQAPPTLGNQYTDDPALRDYLAWKLPAAVRASIEPALLHLGARAVLDVLAAGDDAEARPPRHIPFDAWGRRIDRIDVADGWRALDRIAAEEGLVAIGYERSHGPWSRLDQFARLYLYAPSSATYSCPLAMTDGAARCLEVECSAALHLVFTLAELLGKDECGEASDGERALLRLLTPVVKLFTGKQAIATASEAIEAFGGAGYIEDTGLPRLLRDAQVLSIWEGTTNVLSLDVLRAIDRDGVLTPALTELRRRLPPTSPERERVIDASTTSNAWPMRPAIPKPVRHAPGRWPSASPGRPRPRCCSTTRPRGRNGPPSLLAVGARSP